MAHTNSTPNYNLPQFLGTDKPAWLTDINNAMSDIDTAIAAAKTTADTADTAVGALSVTVGNHTSQLSTLSGAVTSQGNTLNTVTSLIGNGTPTTTDQTLIGAINELNADRDWTAVPEVTGPTTVAIPAGAKELHCRLRSASNDTYGIEITIPVAILEATDKGFRGTFYLGAANYQTASVLANTTRVVINAYDKNGTDSTATATLQVLYR